MLNPVHLRTFMAVARHLSYTRAAREVFLSQPAVSRQVQQLEDELGVALFEQLGRSLHLTDAGRTLQAEAGGLLAGLERVAEAVSGHREGGGGRVRIGAGTTPGYYLLPDILGRFHRNHPEVELELEVGRSRAVERKLLDNELDLGFLGAPPSSDDLHAVTVAKDEIQCFCAPSDPLARQGRPRPAALAGRRWIVREAGSATRELFEAWLHARGVAVERTIQVGCPEAVRTLVSAGLGLGYMSRLAIEADVKKGRLVRLPVRGLRLRRSIHLARHRAKHLSPSMSSFLREARRSLKIPSAWDEPPAP